MTENASYLKFATYGERDAAEAGLKEDFAQGRLCAGVFEAEDEQSWCPLTSAARSTGSFSPYVFGLDTGANKEFTQTVDDLSGFATTETHRPLSQASFDFAIQQIQDARIGS